MKRDLNTIRIDDVEVADRLRPADREVIEALALDIAARGLRTPIEVTSMLRGAHKYRLVAGCHRIEACRLLGHETIATFIVTGSDLELRRDEIMENVGRNELSALELAQFLAELKRVEQALTGATRGGDRRSKEAKADQTEKMSVWFETMAKVRRKTPRTIEQYVAIGERLNDDVASRLRGTVFEDKRGELEALGKFGTAIQNRIADQLLANENAAPTVKSAVKRIEGHPEAAEQTATEKAFRKLLDAWNRAPKPAQRQFLAEIGNPLTEDADG